MTTHMNTQSRPEQVRTGIFKRLLQIVLLILFQAVILFAASGRLDWLMAWVYVGVYFVVVVINSLLLLPSHPELIAERASPKENVKRWDKQISGLIAACSLGLLVVAGLDLRFAASPPLGLATPIVALVLMVAGNALFSWAMVTNAYFSTMVRIQDDRGHAVTSTGPYRFVRHPGYTGWIVTSLTTPLVLGSIWALIPGALGAIFMIVRTALEDKTLQAELDGYTEYAARVQFRLIPGLW